VAEEISGSPGPVVRLIVTYSRARVGTNMAIASSHQKSPGLGISATAEVQPEIARAQQREIIDLFPPLAAKTTFLKPLVRVLSFEKLVLFSPEPAVRESESQGGARLYLTGVVTAAVSAVSVGVWWLRR
jgi:hypothetical protein